MVAATVLELCSFPELQALNVISGGHLDIGRALLHHVGIGVKYCLGLPFTEFLEDDYLKIQRTTK